MKKITLLMLVCLAPVITRAHDIVVPHMHDEFNQNILMYAIIVSAAAIIGIGANKLYNHYKESDHSGLN